MSISRRELLTALLGAPIAAEGCRRWRLRRIDGAIRGGDVASGHRLRGATPEVAAGPARRVGVAIVGSGPSGLSAAWRLERLGERDYVVLDLERRPGGTSAFGTDGIVPYPWGAHYVPVPARHNRALVALLDEIGVLDDPGPDGEPRGRERWLVREPEERLFLDGRWRDGLFPLAGATAADRAELARFGREVDRWVAWRDSAGRRAFTIPVSLCSDDGEVTSLDGISAARWLADHGFRSERLRWWTEYGMRDDYGLSLEQTSAWALLFYHAARRQRPAAPSAPYLAWPEGNGRLVKHLASVAGGRLLQRRLVTDVVPRDGEVELSVVDLAASRLVRYVARHAILAVPQFVAARILRPWRERPPAHAGAFTYAAWMVANLHLSRRPRSRGVPLAWDNVIHDSPSLGYVPATHQALLDHGPTVWTYYHPFVDDDPAAARRKLLAVDHRGACDTILADLGRAHDGLERAVERIDVWRWGHAMIRPAVGFVWGEARRRAAQPLGRVHFAHSDLSGLALFEEAQDHGVRAAEAVLAAQGRTVRPLAG